MDKHQHSPDPKPKRRELSMAKVAQLKDPFCGMMVDPRNAAGTFKHNEQTYYFCSTHCVKRFGSDPEGYLTGKHSQSIETESTKPGATHIFALCVRE